MEGFYTAISLALKYKNEASSDYDQIQKKRLERFTFSINGFDAWCDFYDGCNWLTLNPRCVFAIIRTYDR